MIRIIDLDGTGLTLQQVLDSVQSPEGALLRQRGKVIARLEPADEIDLEDEAWAHDPEQVARGHAARARAEKGQAIPQQEVKGMLDLP